VANLDGAASTAFHARTNFKHHISNFFIESFQISPPLNLFILTPALSPRKVLFVELIQIIIFIGEGGAI